MASPNLPGRASSTLSFYTLDVFTTTRYKGNPLAVVCGTTWQIESLGQEKKQLIAKEFNLSETVFLHLPDDKSADVVKADYFTTSQEIPFAGHPTIGTSVLLLKHLGLTAVKTIQVKAGPIVIQALPHSQQVLPALGRVTASIPHDVHVHKHTLRDVATDGLLGLSADITLRDAELDAAVVSITRGMTFILIKLPSDKYLARVTDTTATLNISKVKGLLDEGLWGHGFVAKYYYVTQAPETSIEGVHVQRLFTRMIEVGFEDPATGSAACDLAAYLSLKQPGTPGQRKVFEITQGREMGRQSDIQVDVVTGTDEHGNVKVAEVHLAGSAVVVMKGEISV